MVLPNFSYSSFDLIDVVSMPAPGKGQGACSQQVLLSSVEGPVTLTRLIVGHSAAVPLKRPPANGGVYIWVDLFVEIFLESHIP